MESDSGFKSQFFSKAWKQNDLRVGFLGGPTKNWVRVGLNWLRSVYAEILRLGSLILPAVLSPIAAFVSSLASHVYRQRRIALALALLMAGVALAGPPGPDSAVEQIQFGAGTVKITRDTHGVPRVFANTLESLFEGDGYAVAEDRAWQLEMYRLDAEGRLAEVFGKKFIAHDEEVRRDGLTPGELAKEFAKLPARDQQILQAYAAGVNHYFQQTESAGSLPPEFKKFSLRPEPWTVEDSMAIMAMMSRRFGGSGTDQLENEAVIHYLAHRLGQQKAMEVFNDLAWVNDPAAITTISSGDFRRERAGLGVGDYSRMPGSTPGDAGQARSNFELLSPLPLAGEGGESSEPGEGAARRSPTIGSPRIEFADAAPGFFDRLHLSMNSAAVFAAARRLGLATRWGSYTWVISPSKSASGHAILLGGPQMGFTTPQIAHQIQLSGAGFNVIGMGFAGIPGVLIGANNHLAWTSTSGESHNEDVFVEKLKPGDRYEYLYRGAWRPMEHRDEMIAVKGAPAVQFHIYRTVHGPVVAWSPDRSVAYSKGMTYFGKEYRNIIGFLGLNTAARIEDIPALCADITSNHNIIAATQNGDIGFWHCGLFPRYAPGLDPRLPLRGTGEDDWRGYLPYGQVPHTVNPASGIIFNWNNKPAPGWNNYSVPAWGAVFRIVNIRNALRRRLKANGGKLSFTEVLSIAPEIGRHNFIADYLKPGLLAAAAANPQQVTPQMKQALSYLSHWDGEVREDGVAQTIFDAWYQKLRIDLFKPVVGSLGSAKDFNRFINPSAVDHVLAGPHSSVKLSYDYLAGRSSDAVRLQALREAIEELRKTAGPEMSRWMYHFKWINFAPLPSIPWYSRGTYIQAVELDPAGVHGVWILPPGESENPDSPHYRDQLYLASWWMYTPMRLMPAPDAP